MDVPSHDLHWVLCSVTSVARRAAKVFAIVPVLAQRSWNEFENRMERKSAGDVWVAGGCHVDDVRVSLIQTAFREPVPVDDQV